MPATTWPATVCHCWLYKFYAARIVFVVFAVVIFRHFGTCLLWTQDVLCVIILFELFVRRLCCFCLCRSEFLLKLNCQKRLFFTLQHFFDHLRRLTSFRLFLFACRFVSIFLRFFLIFCFAIDFFCFSVCLQFFAPNAASCLICLVFCSAL